MPVVPAPCGQGEGGEPGATCCSPSIATTALCLPDGAPLLLVVRSPCTSCGATGSDPETAGWIDPATGAFTAGSPPAGAGPCPAAGCGDVSLLRLCDVALDGTSTPFLRHLVHTCDGQVTAVVDTELDGVTPYTPTGVEGECPAPECEPTPMCPQLLGLSGPETWELPLGTESLSLQVACGPVIVTDCAGNTTRINECGAALSWAAPGTDCAPGSLCGPFSLELLDGAAVYLNFLAPCAQGDDS